MIVDLIYLKYGTGGSDNFGSDVTSDAGNCNVKLLIVAGTMSIGPPPEPAGVGVATPLE